MADTDELIGLIAVAGTFGSVIIGIVCVTLYNMLRVVRETSLKRRLVEAGLTATEIEVVLNAGNRKRGKTAYEKPIAKPVPPKTASAYS